MKPETAKKLFGHEEAADPDSYKGKGVTVSIYSATCTMCDALGVCKFASEWFENPIGLKEMGELVSAVTGMDMDEKKMKDVAARINNVERAYLVLEGIRRKDDYIHGRVMDEPVPTGPHKGKILDREKFGEMLNDYYDIVGWDKKTGIPTRKTLEILGLKDVADRLESLEILP